jgi:nitroimidazol reductase NimA-like FMN-containing flavoprotein (pyridoxamine 5'-phosphate oxidase superfamily)
MFFEAAVRKPDKEITERAEQEAILARAEVLHLAMCLGDQPYVVPLNFAYEDGRIWLHTGRQGLKMDYLRANPKVCFEASVDVQTLPGDPPCRFSARYQSVIGFGRAVEVLDEAERRRGLDILVRRYAGEGAGPLNDDAVARTCVLRLEIDAMTGKRNRL